MELEGVVTCNQPGESPVSSRRTSSASARINVRNHRDRRRERLNTEILVAVSKADLRSVIRLIEEGGSVNATCRESRQTALHVASSAGHNSIAEHLLSKGARARAADRIGRTPAHLAAWNGHITILTLLWQRDPEVVSQQIIRPDTCADHSDDLDSWNHCHHADKDTQHNFTEGSTPLHLACKRSNVSCVNFLLGCGVPIDVRDAFGLTALDVTGEKDAPVPSVPAEEEGSVTGSQSTEGGDDQGISYDSIAFPSSLPKKIKASTMVKKREVFPPADPGLQKHAVTLIARSLIENGAKMPKTPIKEGSIKNQRRTQVTALHTAVLNENLALITLLLESNACLISWNDDGDTPLHVAIKECLMEPLKVMLDSKNAPSGIVDIRDAAGRTLLHLAVMSEWTDGVNQLLEYGASVTTSTNLRENVFHMTAARGNSQIMEELLSIPDAIKVLDDPDHAFLTPLCKAVDAGSLQCTKILVENGADPTYMLLGDLTLLHLAAENNFSEILEYLVNETEAASQMDTRGKAERGGMTPLHSAALLGFADCVEVLLEARADTKALTTEEPYLESTALHLAGKNGHENVVTALLGADSSVLSIPDSRGWYPLHITASRGHSGCVAAMLRAGADLSASIVDEKENTLTGLEVIFFCVPQALNFLVTIFDSFITVNDYPLTDPNCEIDVKFDILMPNPNSTKQMKVLNALLDSGDERLQEKILLHPIVETFLHLKWMKLRLFFIIIMLLYLIFTFSLTALAMTYYVFPETNPYYIGIFNCVLLFSLIPIMMTEAISLIQLQRYYVRDYESWVKWFVFLSALLVGLLNPFAFWWTRQLTSLTVLLAWVELLFLVARCPTWGFYVLMFSRVAIKVLQVLLTFTFLLMGFTFAFMLQFNGSEPFTNLWTSMVKVFVMMFEFDYEATFENMNNDSFLSVASRMLFLIFVVLVAIVLMNLMVGLAVSDIAVLETQGRTQRLAKQIGFLSLLETLVCSRRVSHVLPGPIAAWLAKRRSVLPCVVFRAGGPTLACPDTRLPRPVQASILARVSEASGSSSLANGDLGDLLMRLERLEAIVPSKGQLKDLLRAQSNAIQQVQESVQFLLGLHKINRSNMSINKGSNNNLNVQRENFINVGNSYPMRL